MKQKVYIDTSIVGGYFDEEFKEATVKLFERLKNNEIIFVVSDLLDLELLNAPVSTPFFEPVINWKFKFAEISLSISKGLNYLAIDVDDLSCNLPSIAKTALLVG